MKKRRYSILIVLTLIVGFIVVGSLLSNENKKNSFPNIPEVVKYEPIYETEFDDKKVIFYQRNNDIYYTVGGVELRINSMNSSDGKTRFWWSDAKDSFYENDQLIQPIEVFEANDRKIAIYYLNSEEVVSVVYADEKNTEYVSYVVENTKSLQKNIDYERFDKFVSELTVIHESDSVDYTFTPENPVVVIFRFPYSKIDFRNSMVIENTHTYTLSTSGEHKGILEFENRTDTTKNSYFELTDQQISEFKALLDQ